MPFSFGGSTSKTKSQSTSFDRSQSGSASAGASQSVSDQNIAFEDIFSRLYGGAEGAAAGLDPSLLTGAANTLFSGGTGFLSGIGGDAGTGYLEDRLSSDNAVLEDQIGLLGEDVGKFFNEQLLPGIASEAVAGGQLGGGRQGVAQGRAIDAAGEQFTRGATQLRAGDIAARDSAAGSLIQGNVQGAQTAFQGIPALLGTADAGFGAALSPYERLASIIGGPTTLTSASSSAADFASAFSSSYGESQATSKTKSKAAKISFGQ